jgi:NDP-sugar pyrophosphorylase family protein
MERKYELVEDSYISIGSARLRRVKAVRNFGNVKAGSLGGYIHSEDNLSHEGTAWVGEAATVYEKAVVHGDAWVGDGAKVYGNAFVGEHAVVGGSAWVRDSARIVGRAVVRGEVIVFGSSTVKDEAVVCADARVYGNAQICGKARVCDQAVVAGCAWVGGEVVLNGHTRVEANERLGWDHVDSLYRRAIEEQISGTPNKKTGRPFPVP